MSAAMKIGCVCLRSRQTSLGWSVFAGGLALRLVRCDVCGKTSEVERLTDASTCAICRRLITGSGGDLKASVMVDGVPAILCVGCARRSPHARQWLRWRLDAELAR